MLVAFDSHSQARNAVMAKNNVKNTPPSTVSAT